MPKGTISKPFQKSYDPEAKKKLTEAAATLMLVVVVRPGASSLGEAKKYLGTGSLDGSASVEEKGKGVFSPAVNAAGGESTTKKNCGR